VRPARHDERARTEKRQPLRRTADRRKKIDFRRAFVATDVCYGRAVGRESRETIVEPAMLGVR
jgi:hypothetical protein